MDTTGIRKLLVICLAMLVAVWAGLSSNAVAQDPPAKRADAVDQKLLQELLKRLEQVEAELSRLKQKQGQVPATQKDQKIHTLLETPYFGSVYAGSNKHIRFFAARLIFVNLTPQTVTVKKEDLRLVADGKAHQLEAVPSSIQSRSFRVGNQNFYIRNLKTPAKLKLASGTTGSMWVIFTDLPPGTNVPKLQLKMKLSGQPSILDVNEFARGQLGLEVERIGPRGSLGLLTITGTMNTINAGSLVEELDKLAAQKVVRAVIRWDSSAAPIDSQLRSWLQQAAYQAGRGEPVNNNRFPVIPASIRELHLAQLPNQGGTTRRSSSRSGSSSGPLRIHKTDRLAVSAALRSAYEVLPRDELLQEIQTGNPLTRAAAIAGGGGRLPAEKLPLLLRYADGDDPHIQQSALTALRHFGEQQAIDKLLFYTRKNLQPLASAAIESLASSRYAAAHQALLGVLKNEPPASKKKIIAVLARYPRPIWSETIYEFVTDPNSQEGIEALRALVRVGHPKLAEVLEQSLKQNNTTIRKEAFGVLVGRTDQRSETLAMEFTLAHLQKSRPTSQMLTLLNRTKDRRAVPLLIKHLKRSGSNRASVINTLAKIGDQSVAEMMVQRYPSLQSGEKTAVLNLLRQLHSPQFRKLAGQALLTTDSSLIITACRGLQEDGSREAVKLLIDAFETTTYTSAWSYISNTLSTLATPDARMALLAARDSTNTTKRNYAVNALRNLRQRSPGYQFVSMARQFARQKKWQDAISQYSLAVQLDPQLPEAYSGRGNALLHQSKFQEAGKDFALAMALDPYNVTAVSGLAVVRVIEGKTTEGIKLIEDVREKFKRSSLFAYNTACVYGRALESVQNDQNATDRNKKIEEYQQKALADLKRSIKLGYRDFTWMKQDPDLKALRDLPEFQTMTSGTPATPNRRAVPATPQ